MTTPIQQSKGVAPTTLLLHDILSVSNNITEGFTQIMAKYDLPKNCVDDLKVLRDGVCLQNAETRRLAAKVNVMPLANEAYKMIRDEFPLPWKDNNVPSSYKDRESVHQVKCFVTKWREQEHQTTRARDYALMEEENEAQSPPAIRVKRSKRAVTPDKDERIMNETHSVVLTKGRLFENMNVLIGTGRVKSYVDKLLDERTVLKFGEVTYETTDSVFKLFNAEGINVRPADESQMRGDGTNMWSKEALCKYLSEVEVEEGLTITSLAKRIAQERSSTYTERSGITRMYSKWKERGGIREPGRPKLALLKDLRNGLIAKIDSGTMRSSSLQLEDVKDVISQIQQDKAKADGLDPSSIDTEVCDKTAQTYLIAVSMIGLPEQGVTLSVQNLYNKSITRLIAENSVMAALSNALTVMTTHFLEGKRPNEFGGEIDYSTLSPEVKETFDMVKAIFDAEDVFPVHPSMVISSDDSIVFAFQGAIQNGKWKWKLILKSDTNSGVDSDFEVADNGKFGGLRVRFTFSFTAAGQMAPVYIAVTGLTEEELDPELCPSGFLPLKVNNLCKGGYDVHSNGGFGWIVFMRADKKPKDSDKQWLSMAHRKNLHYNQEVLIPFLNRLREILGWKHGDPIPEFLRACCWCDGDIPQLQALLFEANEVLDEQMKIVRNKHPAAGTAVFQPADKCPIFKLLKHAAARTSGADATSNEEYKKLMYDLINVQARAQGLNLDGNVPKKNGLLDLLYSLPKILDKIQTEDNIKEGFYAGGMINKDTDKENKLDGCVPTYAALMRNCRRWSSKVKGTGTPKAEKDHVTKEAVPLGKIQLKKGQVSAEDMVAADIPRDVLDGKPIEKLKPSGAHAEHMQYAKTMNADWQQRERHKKDRQKAEQKYKKEQEEYSIIKRILSSNETVTTTLLNTTESKCIEDVTIASFMSLSCDQLKDFIHVRTFVGKTFRETKLSGDRKSLNKKLSRQQTAEEIAAECSEDQPCLVWLAWKKRSDQLVLKQRPEPTLEISIPQPLISFETPEVSAAVMNASGYLSNTNWVQAFASTVKGVNIRPVDDDMKHNANRLASIFLQRLNFHIAERVDDSSHNHISLSFVRDNLPAVAAQMCLVGHAMDDVETSECFERLLALPTGNSYFTSFDDDEDKLEGSYVVYHAKKDMWIRSGFASGLTTSLGSRKKKHGECSRSISAMRNNRFYRCYASKDVDDPLVKKKGHFEDLKFYIGMAFDAKDAGPIYAQDEDGNNLFVWSSEFISFLTERAVKKEITLERMQLTSASYLWELCYDLMLAHIENISVSAGIEGLGLKSKKNDD